MATVHDQLLKADRLHAVTQRVGFALWQLQELEGASAQYYVLVVHAKRGMGFEAGQALVDKAQSKTFGSTITQLAKAKQLPQEVETRFQTLLKERNWLVHGSRSSSRNAIHDDQACNSLIERLDRIAEEGRMLLKEIGKHAEAFVKKYGVSTQKIEELAAETLDKWHGDNAL
jgi:hypothetical protein